MRALIASTLQNQVRQASNDTNERKHRKHRVISNNKNFPTRKKIPLHPVSTLTMHCKCCGCGKSNGSAVGCPGPGALPALVPNNSMVTGGESRVTGGSAFLLALVRRETDDDPTGTSRCRHQMPYLWGDQ